MHYNRTLSGLGGHLRLPAEPLRRYCERNGLPEVVGSYEHNLSLSRADALCCKVLGVHPHAVYGDDYFALS